MALSLSTAALIFCLSVFFASGGSLILQSLFVLGLLGSFLRLQKEPAEQSLKRRMLMELVKLLVFLALFFVAHLFESSEQNSPFSEPWRLLVLLLYLGLVLKGLMGSLDALERISWYRMLDVPGCSLKRIYTFVSFLSTASLKAFRKNPEPKNIGALQKINASYRRHAQILDYYTFMQLSFLGPLELGKKIFVSLLYLAYLPFMLRLLEILWQAIL